MGHIAEAALGQELLLEGLLAALPSVWQHHAPTTPLYAVLKQAARREVEHLFSASVLDPKPFGPFGELLFPYHKMGAVDSLDLFGLDELIIFSFYWVNRRRYRRVLDVGANIGLHAILLSRCGYEVRAYEPDPQHFERLQANLVLNRCTVAETVNAAVSSRTGTMEFIRVLGNTTGSHLAGSKDNPYGELERFQVAVEAISPLIAWADLVKLDAEGHEKEILLATSRTDWTKTDALVEVGSASNAAAVFEHLKGIGVGLFSQKRNWQPVCSLEDMPTSHHEGTLFVSSKPQMPWSWQDGEAARTATAVTTEERGR